MAGKKRILMISLYYPPIMGGTPLRSMKWAEGLSEHFNTCVLTASNPDALGIPLDKSIEESKSVEIIRAYSFEIGSIAMFFLRLFGAQTIRHTSKRRAFYWLLPCRHMGWLPFAFLKAIDYMRKNRVEYIYAAYPAPTNIFLGFLIHKLMGKPLLIDMHDSWYPVIKDFLPTALHRRMTRWLEGLMLKSADGIAVATEQIRRDILENHRIDKERIFLLPQSVDLSVVRSVEAKPYETFTIAYTGAITDVQDIPPIVKAANRLLDDGKMPSLRMVLAGPENVVKLNEIRRMDKHNVIKYLGPVSYAESIRIMKSSHVLFLSLARKKTFRYAHPSKIFEYIACGKPILAFLPEGEAARFIRENKLGEAITSGSTDDLASALLKLYSDSGLREFYSTNALKVSEHYDVPVITSMLAKKLEGMG